MPLLTTENQAFDNQLHCPIESCFDELQGEWRKLVLNFMQSPKGEALIKFVNADIEVKEIVYPATPFLALELTPLKEVKVVILGQDPYHGPQQAQGLAFSVSEQVKIPPSLRNMFKELQQDLGIPPAVHGSLVHWAKQGVLLLNTALTVRQGKPASHAKKGWEELTDSIIKKVAEKRESVVFLLWGNHAQTKEGLIKEAMHNSGAKHLILKSNHPSPLSALRPPVPFMGCGHFRKTNEFLVQQGLRPVSW